jgi:hypothetical protein
MAGGDEMTEAQAFDRTSLRHALATLAYRGGKTLRDATPAFAHFRNDATSREPVQILAHIGDLLEWAWWLGKGEPKWSNAEPLPWDDEVARFYALLARFDALLASDEPIAAPLAALFQGPIADALTHVGQLAMLRRVAGEPMKGENYFKAEIVAGRVGPEQTPPKRVF